MPMPMLMPVAIDRRDERPFLGSRGFLLDQRRQRHHLARRQLLRLGTSPQRVVVRGRNRSTIIATRRDGIGVARQRVGFRKQIALEIARRRVEIRDQRAVAGGLDEGSRRSEASRLEHLRHLLDGQALGKCEALGIDVAAGDLVNDGERLTG